MSKGSKQRPCDKKRFNESHDRIFGKETKEHKLREPSKE